MAYFTGKGYGVSTLTDISGRPLLTYQGPNDKTPVLLGDRVAIMKDPTIRQKWSMVELHTPRMPLTTSKEIKSLVGGTPDQELDHKIPLELCGSNSIMNLRLETHVAGSANTQTDIYENALADQVMNGVISLQEAWLADAKVKGYLLGELSPQGVQITFNTLLPIIQSAFSSRQPGLSAKISNSEEQVLQAQITQNKAILKENPYSLNARQGLFHAQVLLSAGKTSMTLDEATANILATTYAYAKTQGTNNATVSGSMGTVQSDLSLAQQSMDWLHQSFIPGAMKIVLQWLPFAPLIVGAAIVAVILVLAYAPVEIGAALTEAPLIGLVAKAANVSFLGAAAVGIFLWAEFVIAWGGFGMSFNVKEYLDAMVIAPAMVVDAANKAKVNLGNTGGALPLQMYTSFAQAQAAYSGGTIPEQPLSSGATATFPGLEGGVSLVGGNVPTYTPIVPVSTTPSVASTSVSGTSVHVSIVSGGVLGSPATFTPATSDIFENMTELQAATEENLAKYIGALPGQLAYELRLVNHITLADGTMRIGTTQTIIKGYTKGSKKTASHPEYKKVTNKFLVADIKYKALAGGWKKLDEIVVGAVDETAFKPTAQELAGLGDAIGTYLVANHLGGVTTINLPAAGSTAPASTSAPQSTAPAETPSAASASLTAAFQPTTPAETAAIANAVAQIPTVVAPVAAPAPAQKTDSIGSGTGNTMVYNIPYTTDGSSIQYYTGPDGGGPNLTQRQSGLSLLNKQTATPKQAYTQAQITTPVATAATKPKYCLVGDLYDYWNAKGLPHPGVVANGLKYQALGLGSASVFVGSVGQNTRLLQALQAADGC